ncbi:hypothetical protein Tco_1417528 [Tanacetum coccineum]
MRFYGIANMANTHVSVGFGIWFCHGVAGGEEQEANVALTEEWDDIQAKIKADHELAQRLQAQDQEELSDAEKATLFVQLLEKRRKYFAAKRAE